MFMKTTRDERIARVVLGLGVMFVGSFSFMEIAIAGYLFGLLLIGIGVYPKSTEYAEDVEKGSAPAKKASPSLAKASESAPVAAAPKARASKRRKAAS
jgi:hypothetical protein